MKKVKLNLKKIHIRRLGRLFRQGTAAVLASVLFLGLLTPGAFADSSVNPVTIPVNGEKPVIQIEQSLPVDDPGYLEVAIKVTTPKVIETQHTFRYVGAALEFNTAVLKPVSWKDSRGKTTDVNNTYATDFDTATMVALETKSERNDVALDAKVSDRYFWVTARMQAAALNDVAIIVVRFAIQEGNTIDQNWMDATDNWLVRFAPDADAAESAIHQQLWYDSGSNSFYYSDAGAGSAGKLTEPSDVADPDSDSDYYTHNLLALGTDLSFTFVTTNRTYDKSSQANAATILYYDYTNDLIGVQLVTPGDARQEVNDYVERNFIYHNDVTGYDLRASANSANAALYTDSLDRQFTYRGEYPYTGAMELPSVIATTTKYGQPTYAERLRAYKDDIKDYVVDDGAKFPLTNKLDYVFFKRVTTADETATINGKEVVTKYTAKTLSEAATAAAAMPTTSDEEIAAAAEAALDAKYPYIHGWAVVDDISKIEDVWTTLGCGELGAYGRNGASKDTIDTSGEASCLQFADFSDLEQGKTYYVKAVYEPGTLLYDNYDYIISAEPYYERYGATTAGAGGVYSITFAFSRVAADGRGVFRTRDPALRLDYTLDVNKEAYEKVLSLGMDVSNTDTIEVTITPSSGVLSMDYTLRDKKPFAADILKTRKYNFYTGDPRSAEGNAAGIVGNYNYSMGTAGTDGFVMRGIVGQINHFATLAYEGDSTNLTRYINYSGLNDAGFFKSDGVSFRVTDNTFLQKILSDTGKYADARNQMKTYDNQEIQDTVSNLDWLKIQYHLYKGEYNSGSDTVTKGLWGEDDPDEMKKAVTWQRNEGTAPNISSWEDVRTGLYTFGYENMAGAFGNLKELYWRQGQTAVAYGSVADLKTALENLSTAFKAGGVPRSTIESLTWKQIQYLLEEGGTAIPNDVDIGPGKTYDKDYWWENGGTKTITTWGQLVEIENNIVNHGYDPSWLDDLTKADGSTPILTEGLKVNSSDNKAIALRTTALGAEFGTLADLLRALDRALALLSVPYPNESALPAVPIMEFQHVMISGNSYRTDAALRADSSINYYWITGAPTPTTLQALVDLVKQVNSGYPDDLMENVTVSSMSGSPFWLRTATGAEFTGDSALRDVLKTAVSKLKGTEDFTTAATLRQNWSILQQILIGGEYAADPDPSGTIYWWYDGGHKPITDLASLLEAAWNSWGKPGGSGDAPDNTTDANAMDALEENEATLKMITGIPRPEGNTGHGNSGYDGYFDFRAEGGVAFGSVEAFKKALKENVIEEITAKHTAKSYVTDMTWMGIQHMLLGGEGDLTDNQIKALGVNYWWQNGGEESTYIDYTWGDAEIKALLAIVHSKSITSSSSANYSQLTAALTTTVMESLNIHLSDGTILDGSDSSHVDTLAGWLIAAAKKLKTPSAGNWSSYRTATKKGNTYTYSNLRLPWKPFQKYVYDESILKDDAIDAFAWGPADSEGGTPVNLTMLLLDRNAVDGDIADPPETQIDIVVPEGALVTYDAATKLYTVTMLAAEESSAGEPELSGGEDKDARIAELEAMLAEKDAQLKEKDARIAELEARLAAVPAEAPAADTAITENDASEPAGEEDAPAAGPDATIVEPDTSADAAGDDSDTIGDDTTPVEADPAGETETETTADETGQVPDDAEPQAAPPSETTPVTDTSQAETAEGGGDEMTTADIVMTARTKLLFTPLVTLALQDSGGGGGRGPLLYSRSIGKVVTVA